MYNIIEPWFFLSIHKFVPVCSSEFRSKLFGSLFEAKNALFGYK